MTRSNPGGIDVSAPSRTLLISDVEVSRMGSALRELDHTAEAIALFEWNAQRLSTSSSLPDTGPAAAPYAPRGGAIATFAALTTIC